MTEYSKLTTESYNNKTKNIDKMSDDKISFIYRFLN